MRHFGQSGDHDLPFLSALMPNSFQTAVTASLINEILASPAARSPDSAEPSHVCRSLLLFLIEIVASCTYQLSVFR